MKIFLNILLSFLCVIGLYAMEDFLKASEEAIAQHTLKNRKPNETLLQLIKEDNLDLVKYILDNGAIISFGEYKPLLLAAELGSSAIISYFLNHEEIPEDMKKIAAEKARNNNHNQVAMLLDYQTN